ncbi:MAG: phenylalanine--tRNA ligase beta subunit-related protein [Patescibacteria group bacterium]
MNIPISYSWLRSHFDQDIPSPEEISTLFMERLCEVEGIEKKNNDIIFDLKIMPDRGHDLLCHNGIAREISVIASIPIKTLQTFKGSISNVAKLNISVSDNNLCPRYMGRVIENVKVGESPSWLRERLLSVGQRSINNVVDITNFVMLELGQPMHAFDMTKLIKEDDGITTIFVRSAKDGEKITTLDGKDIVLTPETLVIADGKQALAIAGVKGGKDAGVDETTTSIVLESANFNAVQTRKTSQRVGIRTDSSKRFEHDISPALAEDAMDLATALLVELCPDAKVGEVVDIKTREIKHYKVGFAVSEINSILGTTLNEKDINELLGRVGFVYDIVLDSEAQIVAMAQTLIGKSYKYGASVQYDSQYAFDCSSLTSYLFVEAGVAIPRMTVDQLVFGKEISQDEMKAGDLIFSNSGVDKIHYESIEWMKGTKVPEGVDHVGLYLGDGKVIHASRYNKEGVAVENLKESERFKNIVGVRRIEFPHEPRFVVTIPHVRLDLRIKEDMAEELGRIYGYGAILDENLPHMAFTPHPLKAYYDANIIRDTLVSRGFSEVYTYSFQNEGMFAVANPIAEDKGFLRKDLATGLSQSLVLNTRNAPLLGQDDIKIFEIGKVFPGVMVEKLSCAIGIELTKAGKKKDALTRTALEEAVQVVSKVLGVEIAGTYTKNTFEFDLDVLLEKLPLLEVGAPFKAVSVRYEKPSVYPFMLRDIAMWAKVGASQDEILSIIRTEGGALLVRDRLFDVFTKDFDGISKTSYAFNLVFQSYEKTLSDDEVNEVMKRITDKLSAHGLEVR